MGDSVTVLIVDDDPLVRVTFVRILQHGGFRTIAANEPDRVLLIDSNRDVGTISDDVDRAVARLLTAS